MTHPCEWVYHRGMSRDSAKSATRTVRFPNDLLLWLQAETEKHGETFNAVVVNRLWLGNYICGKARESCALSSGQAGAIPPAMIEAGAYVIEAASGCQWSNAVDAARDVLALTHLPFASG